MSNKKPSGYWDDYENCKNECKKYRYIRDLKKNSSGCYLSLIRNKWKDEFYPNRTKIQSKWEIKEKCIEKAKRYHNFGTFMRQAYDCYLSMKENGWLEEVFSRIPNYEEIKFWNNYENCKEECKKYHSIRQLRKNNLKCYYSILRNGWKDNFFNAIHKETKPFGYWNDIEHCIEESKKYTTITELKDKSNGCYASVLKHHWENDCFHSFKKRKPNGHWDIKENCMEEAKKYRNISEFQKCAYGAYNCAKKNGWIEEIDSLYNKTIMYHFYDEKIHSVYIYLLEEDKVFYVGRTNGLKRRHQQHIRDCNDTLNKYCKNKGIEIPNYIILKEELTAQESQYYEDFYLNEYKQKGWTPLNVAVTGVNKGSLGATCKWNYEECKKEASKYRNITEFEQGSQSAYNACKKNGWTYDFFTPLKKEDHYWDCYENCKKAFEECSNARELIKKFGGCYNSIKKNKFNDLRYKRNKYHERN